MWRNSLGRSWVGLALGLLGAVLAVWWLCAPMPARPVAAQEQRVRPSALIYGEQRVSQIVAVPREGVSAVQFWLLAHRREGGAITLHVAALERPEEELARVSIPLAELPERPPITFELPPFTQAGTPVLILTLEAPELDRARAISVLGGDNNYGQGLLILNGELRPAEDLAFVTFASEVRGDRWLPLSRMVQGRPGLFGQPALYVALLWLAAWSYGWVLLALVSWVRRQLPRPARQTNPYTTRRLTDT